MKRLLAIDTSTWWGSVALLESDADGCGRVVAEQRRRVEDSHAARLLPMIDEVLAAAGWDRASIDAYAAVRGPGSFTGIRVGLGVVRGLGLASGRPCVGVNSLEAMADAFGPAEVPRLPLLDAARGDVYGAVYDAASTPPVELQAPWLGRPGTLGGWTGPAAIAFGAGASLHAAEIPEQRATIAAVTLPEGLAGAAGRIAWHRMRTGAGDGNLLSPLYLRPADAELKA